MTVQPLDPVVQLILRKVVIFGIICLELTSIYGSKSPFHSTADTAVELMEDRLQTADVVLPKIRNRPEIRLYTAGVPLSDISFQTVSPVFPCLMSYVSIHSHVFIPIYYLEITV